MVWALCPSGSEVSWRLSCLGNSRTLRILDGCSGQVTPDHLQASTSASHYRTGPRLTSPPAGSPPAGTSAGLVLLLPSDHPAFSRQPGGSNQFGDLSSLALAKVGTPKSHTWDKDLDASRRVSQGRRENNLSIDHQGHCLWHWVRGWILGSRRMLPLVVQGGGLFIHQLSLVVGCLGSLTSLRFWAVLTWSQVGCRGFWWRPQAESTRLWQILLCHLNSQRNVTGSSGWN